MSATGVAVQATSEGQEPMSEIIEQPTDWQVTYRDILDFRDAPLPPVLVERASTTSVVPGGARVMAVEGERRALARIIAAVTAAKSTVVAGSFLFSLPELEGALRDAARRGVRVYFLVASENRLFNEPKADSEFDQRVFEEHKQLLDRLAGWVLIRTAADWHAKAVLIDDGPEGAGFLLTANLTTEAVTRNEELVVTLTAHERTQLRKVARWALWNAAQHEIVEPGKLRAVSPLAEVPKPVIAGPLVSTLQERGSLHQAMLETIGSAQRELIVSSYGWDATHPAVVALCTHAREGCAVTVLARARPASMPALVALAQAGARVLIFRWLHAKAIWSDAGRAVVASANLEPQGLDRGIELGVVLEDERVTELYDVLHGWTARASHELRVDARLGDLHGKIVLWRNGKLETAEIVPKFDATPEDIVAPSADRLDPPPLPAVDRAALPRPLAHEHAITRRVMAPALDPRAKPIEGDGSGPRPRLFREAKGRLVVAIDSPEQLEAARALADAHGGPPIVVERRLP